MPKGYLKDPKSSLCLYCGRPFFAIKTGQKYCPGPCAQKQRQLQKDRCKAAKGEYNREKSRWQRMEAKYRITKKQYKRMFANQGGVCAICGLPSTLVDKRTGKIRKLAVDHCHETGLVRGLLCGNCNRGLGMFGDEVSILHKALAYLEETV